MQTSFHSTTSLIDPFLATVAQNRMKKCLERRKECALDVVKRSQKFSLRHRPPYRGAGRPKFNQLKMVTTFTYRPSLVKIDARNFELLW